MGMAEFERKKDEKIDGVIQDMVILWLMETFIQL